MPNPDHMALARCGETAAALAQVSFQWIATP
jgi:hypothetical protein